MNDACSVQMGHNDKSKWKHLCFLQLVLHHTHTHTECSGSGCDCSGSFHGQKCARTSRVCACPIKLPALLSLYARFKTNPRESVRRGGRAGGGGELPPAGFKRFIPKSFYINKSHYHLHAVPSMIQMSQKNHNHS